MAQQKVLFQTAHSVPEELEKAKRLAPVFQELAILWGKRIVVDAPRNRQTSPETREDNTVYVHLFAYPNMEGGGERIPASIRNVFGVDVPQPTRVPGPIPGGMQSLHVGSCFPPSAEGRNIHTIYGAENAPVAEIAGAHIYILFHAAYAEWAGDAEVLRILLTKALAFMCDEEDTVSALTRGASLRTWLRNKAVAGTDEQRSAFTALARQMLLQQIEEAKKRRKELSGAVENLIKSQVSLGFEMDSIQHRLIDAESIVNEREAGEEFDLLLSWPLVRGIRVDADTLKIYTHPITMEMENGDQYPIGEHIIAITPKDTTENTQDMRSWIKIGEDPDGWKGPFRHNAVGAALEPPPQSCWGNQLNPAVEKALGEYDFLYAANSALTFLAVETGGAKQRESAEQDSNAAHSSAAPEPLPFYNEDRHREQERNRYIALVRRFRKEVLKERLHKNYAEHENKVREHSAKIAKTRAKLQATEGLIAFLERCESKLPTEEEFARLIHDPALIGLTIYEQSVWASFAPAALSEQALFSMQEGVVIRLTPSANTACAWGWVSGRECDLALPAEDGDSHFWRLVRFGMLGTALAALRDIAQGKPVSLKELAGTNLEPFLENGVSAGQAAESAEG